MTHIKGCTVRTVGGHISLPSFELYANHALLSHPKILPNKISKEICPPTVHFIRKNNV